MDRLAAYLPSAPDSRMGHAKPNTGGLQAADVESLDNVPVCPQCHDRGWVSVAKTVGLGFEAVPCPACYERPKREVILGRCGIPQDMIEMCRLDTYRPQTPRQHQALADCRKWVNGQLPPVLLLVGPVGVGKSHLSLAVLGELADKGIYGHYTTSVGLFDRLKKAIGAGDFDDIWAWYCANGLLALSDLGTQHHTDFEQERLFELIDHRIETAFGPPVLLTVITSNLHPTDSGFDDRIASRLQNRRVVHRIEFDGPDMRRRLTPKAWGIGG